MPERFLGQTIGKYRVIRLLGGGAFAWVYEAIDRDLEIPVALKVLRPEFAGDHIAETRFRREASTAARLRHPNIVVVRDVGQSDGASFVAMDLLGDSVGHRLRHTRTLAEHDVVRLGIDVASALAVAHGAGVIHRDIKPDNLLLGASGEAVVADFGLARALTNTAALSASNQVMGTPHYFSPEQARGLELDGRSDLYSLGVTLYRAATGKLPFDGDDWYTVGRQHIESEVPRPRDIIPALTPQFEAILLRLLAKSPSHRYESATELADALRAIVTTAVHPTKPGQQLAPGATAGPHPPIALIDESANVTAIPRAAALPPWPFSTLQIVSGLGIAALVLFGVLRVFGDGGTALSRAIIGRVAAMASDKDKADANGKRAIASATDSARHDLLQDSLFGLIDSAKGASPSSTGSAPSAPPTVGATGATNAPSSVTQTSANGTTRGRLFLRTAPEADLYIDGARVGAGSWSGERPTDKLLRIRAEIVNAPEGCTTSRAETSMRLRDAKQPVVNLLVRNCTPIQVDIVPRDAHLVFTSLEGGATIRVRADSADGILLVDGRYMLTGAKPRCADYRDTVSTAERKPGGQVLIRFSLFCS